MAKRTAVIFGCGDLAQVLACHLEQDSDYSVDAFTVDRERIESAELMGRPVVPFDELERTHPATDCVLFVGVGYSKVNRARAEVFERCKSKGYRLGTYVSTRAMIREPFRIGEGSVVFDGALIHPFVTIGCNVVVWGLSHIGHHAVVGDHCFLACATLSGRTAVGAGTFLGANSCVTEGVAVGAGNIIGAGALVTRDTNPGEVYRPQRTKASPVRSDRLWK